MQLDMTGFVDRENNGIGLTDEGTDAGLNAFVSDLVINYIKLPAGAVHCGFACSDHVGWYNHASRVVYPFETMNDTGNPYKHTTDDVLKKLSLVHMVDFIKLCVAFAVELAEPVTKS